LKVKRTQRVKVKVLSPKKRRRRSLKKKIILNARRTKTSQNLQRSCFSRRATLI
jgi:hypothetical protein